MDQVDITIIGAGVVGLAVARALSQAGRDVLVVERHASFGEEASSRNSEVIHAGLYYPLGSLKSRLCIAGREALYRYCADCRIPHAKTGKLVVACTDDEAARVRAIFENARASGVDTVRWLTGKEIQKLEPDVAAREGFFSSETGIIDTHRLMQRLSADAQAGGAQSVYNTEVVALERQPGGFCVTVQEPGGGGFSFSSRVVVNAAGLHADRVAALAGIDIDQAGYRLHWCKGQYFRVRNPKVFSITRLIYPPPTVAGLGIHITPDLGGGLRLGPDTAYVSAFDYGVDEAAREVFLESVRTFLPRLALDNIIPDTAGVRAKLQPEGGAVRDFVVEEESGRGLPGLVNLIGIESPGLTACMSIADRVKELMRL